MTINLPDEKFHGDSDEFSGVFLGDAVGNV